jgi:hypothetical protein
MTPNQIKLDRYREQDRQAAAIILADVAKYGGEGALLVQVARRVLEKPAAAAGGPMRRDEVYSSAADAGNTVELPRGASRASERLRCPRCGAALEIGWRCTCAPLPQAAARKAG